MHEHIATCKCMYPSNILKVYGTLQERWKMYYLLENVEGNKVEWILEVELSSGVTAVSVFSLDVKILKNFSV